MPSSKISFAKPILFGIYGFPGAGKSYLARNLSQDLPIAYVSADKIRGQLFERPQHNEREDYIVGQLMDYLAEEFLNAGVSVIYDINAKRKVDRRKLDQMARRHHGEFLLLWLQIDQDTAFARTQNRDRRRIDDKFAADQTTNSFQRELADMQNPQREPYIVLSGKHGYISQKNTLINHLYKIGLIQSDAIRDNVAKPGLVNLVPNPQAMRVDLERRNITIS